MAVIKTITYSEDVKGWTSFWDYQPSFAFSIRGSYYSTKDATLYKHYDESFSTNRGYYYGTHYPSEITLILNEYSGVSKTFKTVGYEGSNGWEVSNFESDEFSPTRDEYTPISITDTSQVIKSYGEGLYYDGGVEYRSGFDKKENKYFAHLVNNSVTFREGQVLEGENISGIKGLFSTVTFKTDLVTRVGGSKQLFSVFSEYNRSYD